MDHQFSTPISSDLILWLKQGCDDYLMLANTKSCPSTRYAKITLATLLDIVPEINSIPGWDGGGG
jgi:hypothetical protein